MLQNNRNRIRERNSGQKPQSAPLTMQTRKSTWSAAANDAIHPSQRRRLNVRVISGIVTLVLSLMAAGFTFLPLFRVDTPSVTGSEQVNIQEVTYYTGIRSLPLYMVDPQSLREILLKRYPEARDVKIMVELPNKVDIRLEQRIAIVEWDFGGNKFWLDEEGTVMKDMTTAENMIYVLANSFPGAKNRNDRKLPTHFSKKMMKSILEINKVKPAGKTLYFTFDNGYGWMTDQEYTLWFGVDDTDLTEKLAMADSMNKYFKDNEILPEMLSLEFTRAPYYRYAE